MKIQLLNYGSSIEMRGGDTVQIQQTARWLTRFGHHVSVCQGSQTKPGDYDLIHIFNCRHVLSFSSQIEAVAKEGIPCVVSPIWISLPEAIWGSRASAALLTKEVQEPGSSADLFQKLKERTIRVEVDGEILGFADSFPSIYRLKSIGDSLRNVQALLPNSWLELQSVRMDLCWHGEQFAVAHYGVDPAPFINATHHLFREWIGSDRPFVLQVGRIEPAKNAAMLLWALRDTGLDVVLAGDNQRNPDYVQMCRKIGGDRVKLVGHLDIDLLASAYAAASCHALPSWCETCGLVSLEAALTGAPVVGSTVGHEVEYLQGDAWLADPADPADPAAIRRAVEEAIAAGRDSERPRRLRQRVLEQFNWLRTAEATEALYKQVLC